MCSALLLPAASETLELAFAWSEEGNMNMVIPYEPLLEEPITEYSSGKSESPLRSLRLQAAQMVQE